MADYDCFYHAPLRSAFIALLKNQGRLWRYRNRYGPDPAHAVHAVRTIEILIRLQLCIPRQRPRPYVSITRLGRQFAYGDRDFAQELIVMNAMRQQGGPPNAAT